MTVDVLGPCPWAFFLSRPKLIHCVLLMQMNFAQEFNIFSAKLRLKFEAVWFLFKIWLFLHHSESSCCCLCEHSFLKLIYHSYSMQEHFGIIVLTHIPVPFSWSFWLLLPWGLYIELSILIWFVSPENRWSFQMSEVKIHKIYYFYTKNFWW